jgi:hypothetical protein
MTRLFLVPALLLGMLFTVAIVRANEAPPRPNPKSAEKLTVPLTIEIDDKATEPRLVIPRKFVAAWNATEDGVKQERADAGLPRLHTMTAGFALSGAFVFGGLWLVRFRGRFGGRGLTLLLGTMALLGVGGAAFVWANAAPPRPIPNPVNVASFGKVPVDFVDKGDSIKLIVSRAHLDKVNEPAAAK